MPHRVERRRPRRRTTTTTTTTTATRLCLLAASCAAAVVVEARLGNGRRRAQWSPVATTTPVPITIDPAAASSSSSSSSSSPAAAAPADDDDEEEECPPGHSGYHPGPGCLSYYWCQAGMGPSSTGQAIYECIEGLLFDVATGICNWEAVVACSRPLPEPTQEPTPESTPEAEDEGAQAVDLVLASFSVDTTNATTSEIFSVSSTSTSTSKTTSTTTFRKRRTPHLKEVVGYWRSGDQGTRVASPDSIDYSKLTRINFDAYAVDATGMIIFASANGAVSPDVEFLLGPRVWEDAGDGKGRNYCWAAGTQAVVNCELRDYRRGMLHMAHEAGVEVYPTITLGEGATVSTLAVDAFVANALALLVDNGFDGIDLDLTMTETDPISGSPSTSAASQSAEVDAFRGIVVGMRTRIGELMTRDNRSYGLTLAMPCASHTTPSIGEIVDAVDEVNLMTFDFNSPSNSELVLPNSPLYTIPEDIDSDGGSVDSCVGDWTSGTSGTDGGAIASRDRINVGMSFDGRVYRGAQALYGPHDTVLPAGVEEEDAEMPYHEIRKQLDQGTLSKGWDDVTKTIFGGNTGGELITYEDAMSVCWKTDYGIENDVNGYFVWDLTADVLDDKTTPLLDAINSRLALSDYDCTLGKSKNTTSSNDADVVTLTIDGENITGWYGPPRYYPDFVSQGCGDDPGQRPTWVSDEDMYQTKQQCCSENFQWIGRTICLGENFLETNFLTAPPTSFPSMAPSVMPSEVPSAMPSVMLSPPPAVGSTSTIGWANVDAFASTSMEVLAQGLCAKDEAHLAQIVRMARPCNEFLPCPEGLQCFTVDLMNVNTDEVPVNVNSHEDVSGTSFEVIPPPRPTSDVPASQAHGLCAETEEELPFVFRTAQPCSEYLPCPRGLLCFTDSDFMNVDTQDEALSMNPPSYTVMSDRSNGLCAETEEELPFVFRTAQPCSEYLPCPQGLLCFTDTDFMNVDTPSDMEMTPHISSLSAYEDTTMSGGNDSSTGLPLDSETAPYASLYAHGGSTLSVVPDSFVSIPVDADSTLSEEEPFEAYGFDPTLAVSGGPAGKSTSSILKFDVSFIQSDVTIVDVKLRLFVMDGSGFCGKFTIIGDSYKNDWSEKSVTYASAPTDFEGIVIGNAWDVKPGQWFEMDVTGAFGVLDWAWEEVQSLSIHITSTAENQCIFSSSNGPTTYAPHLVVKVKEEETFAPSTEPATDSSTSDKPLLEPWKAYVDFSGRSYYYNPDTGVTQWEKPVAPPSGLCAKDESELPLVFRTAQICTANEPCPEGQECFMDVDFLTKSTEAQTATPHELPIAQNNLVESTETPTDASTSLEPLVLRATDDATIYYDDPVLNNDGQKESIVVENDGTMMSDILIRFDISSIHEMVPKKALLVLYVEETCQSAGVFTTTYDFDSEWNDLDVSHMSWTTDGLDGEGVGTMIGSFGQTEGGKWSGLDVTSAFHNDAVFEHAAITFRGTSDNGSRCQFGSVQGGKAPKLMVEF